MKRSLASTVGGLNKLLAVLFIVGGPLVGALAGRLDTIGYGVIYPSVSGLLIGLLVGCVLAITVCGLLALFVSMHATLDDLKHKENPPPSEDGRAS